MTHILGKRVQDRSLAVIARDLPLLVHRFVVKYRDDEDLISTLQVIAHSEAEVRETMEEVLGRSDFEIARIGL